MPPIGRNSLSRFTCGLPCPRLSAAVDDSKVGRHNKPARTPDLKLSRNILDLRSLSGRTGRELFRSCWNRKTSMFLLIAASFMRNQDIKQDYFHAKYKFWPFSLIIIKCIFRVLHIYKFFYNYSRLSLRTKDASLIGEWASDRKLEDFLT